MWNWLRRIFQPERPLTGAELIGKMTIDFNAAVNAQLAGGRKPCTMRFRLNPQAKALFSDLLDQQRPPDKPVPRDTAYDANFHGVPIDWVESRTPVELVVTQG